MIDSPRELVAAIIAPLTPSALVLVLPALFGGSWSIGELALLTFPTVLCSYLAFLLLGLPFISALRRRGHLSLVNLALGGAGLGAVGGQLILVAFALVLGSRPFDGDDLAVGYLLAALWGGGLGLATAVAYGVIAGRPNNSFKPKPLRGSA